MKYTGNWSANNGRTYNSAYHSNNKHKLAKEMRKICRHEVFEGNSGYWSVLLIDGHTVVMEGNENNEAKHRH